MPEIQVRTMGFGDIEAVALLQRCCFPAPFPEELLWTASHLSRHLEVFPRGQFIAALDDRILASASNCIVREEVWSAHLPWLQAVGGPYIDNHDGMGSTLYGLDISVHPAWRGQGIMRRLYRARFDLVRELGLMRYGTAVRIPGYSAFRIANPRATPEDYLVAVVERQAIDQTLTPMLRVGLQPKGVIRDYMDDTESHNAAVVLEWLP